ncbi:2-haloalkanoic acid dehalogenase [Pseudoalteromonas luteoviolacea B = ATCC 29581]|nr:2-haloalkanoic acid dehalogenase [Pseudoalteromonas luteoviolacea B = ATCC 29581]
MKIDESAVWVFDLDDTIYPERDYQLSGYRYLANHLKELFQKDIFHEIMQADSSNQDVLDEICKALSLPIATKESLIWMYRLHVPDIKLTNDVTQILDEIRTNYSLAIITDGRAVSQRNKVKALGLGGIDILISEEWGEVKPGKRRFKELENRYLESKQFIYVGDNIKKDFITPNEMGWLTIGVKDKGFNIHSQDVNLVKSAYLPKMWIDSFSELRDFLC